MNVRPPVEDPSDQQRKPGGDGMAFQPLTVDRTRPCCAGTATAR